MKVFIERENETKEVTIDTPVALKVILSQLNIAVESVILVKNGDICLEDELVNNDDEIKLLSVVSGG